MEELFWRPHILHVVFLNETNPAQTFPPSGWSKDSGVGGGKSGVEGIEAALG